jgi:putative DeoR family transcriptional regulator (stage III sporulation protein D)
LLLLLDKGGVKMYSDTELRVIEAAEYTIKNKTTIRETAKHMGVSKTSVHWYLTKKLPLMSPKLSKEVREVLDFNTEQRATRGGIALGKKYKEGRE